MGTFSERARRGISRCSVAELEELRSFQALNYGARAGQQATTQVDWLFTTNPYRSPEGFGLWIARRKGRIVGQQAEIGVGLRVGSERVRAAIPTELMVDPAWRLHGLGPALSEAMREASRVAFVFLITEDAARMYRGGGWPELGEVPRFVFPLEPAAVTSGRLRQSLARDGLGLLAGAEALAARVRAAPTQLEQVDVFDERADAVWEREATSYSILTCRTAKDLRWRFDSGPHARLYRRFYLMRAGRALGYVVVRVKPWRGFLALRIVDYLVAPRLVGTLFAHCVALARSETLAMVEVLTLNHRAHRAIRLRGFLRSRPKPPARLMVAIDDSDPLREQVLDFDRWFITSADGDEELVDCRRTANLMDQRSEGEDSPPPNT